MISLAKYQLLWVLSQFNLLILNKISIMIIVRLSHNNRCTHHRIIMYHNNQYINLYISQHLFMLYRFSLSIISQFIILLIIISRLTSLFLRLLHIQKIIRDLIMALITKNQLM